MNVWMTARGAGLSALVLLTASTVLGTLMTNRWKPSTKVVAQHVHRVVSLVGLGVLALHITTILMDTWAHVGVTGALIPFTSTFRATAVGLGTIGMYLMLFAAAIGVARGRFTGSPRAARVWRALHFTGYASWFAALLHGFAAGTDSHIAWVRLLYVVCLLSVASAIAFRATSPRPSAASPVRTFNRPVRVLQGADR